MKNITYFLAIGILLTLACSLQTLNTSWSKPGAQPGEHERAQAECDSDKGMSGLSEQTEFEVCMKQKGWFLIEEAIQ